MQFWNTLVPINHYGPYTQCIINHHHGQQRGEDAAEGDAGVDHERGTILRPWAGTQTDKLSLLFPY